MPGQKVREEQPLRNVVLHCYTVTQLSDRVVHSRSEIQMTMMTMVTMMTMMTMMLLMPGALLCYKDTAKGSRNEMMCLYGIY